MDRQKLSCPKERKIMDMEKRLNSLKGIGILACIAVFFCHFRLAPNVLAAHLIVYILMTCGLPYNAEAAQLSGSLGFLDVFNDFVPKLFQCLREAAFSCFLMGESSYIGPLWVMTYEFLGGLLVLAILSV